MTTDKTIGVRYRWASALMIGLALILVGSSTSWAVSRNIRVGQLWDIYDDIGHEGWGGPVMIWPGGFWLQDLGNNSRKDYAAYKAFLVGTKDWVRPASDASWKAYGSTLPDVPANVGDPMPYYVVQRDTRGSKGEGFQLIRGGTAPNTDLIGVKLYYKTKPATITTDGKANPALEVSDGQDATLPADAKIVSQWGTNMGITITRTVYAFVHPDHDDYHIWHYNFKNTGKYCCPPQLVASAGAGGPSLTHSLQVPNLLYSPSIPYNDRAEGGIYTGACCEWSGDAVQDYQGHSDADPYPRQDVISDAKQVVQDQFRGATYNKPTWTFVDAQHPVRNYGDLRTVYTYDGDAPTWAGTDFGDPHNVTGRNLSDGWPGINLVHCDVSPTNRADDPDQPRRAVYHNWGLQPEYYLHGMEALYREMVWPGGKFVDNEKRFQRDAIRLGQAYGAGANLQFVGPQTIFSVGGDNWDLDPGDEVNVIFVSAVSGHPYQEQLAAGSAWLTGGGYNTAAEEKRLRDFFAGEDSLFTAFRRAQDAIGVQTSTVAELEASLRAVPALQSAPANPATFKAVSGTARLDLSWSAVPGVDGYRIYRTTGSRLGDYPWVRVAEPGQAVMSYKDSAGVQVGIGYYYYIVSVKNGVESSMHAARTAIPVSPFTAPAAQLDRVIVVPNPWDWRYQNNTFVGAQLAGRQLPGFSNQVTFRGLVDRCTIHIYTLDGVEIRTIEHVPNLPEPGVEVPFGTQAWDLKTDGGQTVVTGVYIYVVDSPDKGKYVGKLVIIR